MSKRVATATPSHPTVASRTTFQFLDVDSGEEEEEVSVDEQDDVLEPEAPKSKKALKRAAAKETKEAKRAARAQASSLPKEKPTTQTESTPTPAPTVSTPEIVEVPPTAPPPTAPPPTAPPPTTLVAPQEQDPTPLKPSEPVPRLTITPLLANGNGVHSRSKVGNGSPSPTTGSMFHPSLPASLPYPPSPGLGPRKRKASEDLKTNPLSKESKVEFVSGQADGTVEVKLVPTSVNLGADHDKGKKKAAVITRTIWTLIMIGGFLLLLAMGHTYMILLVLFCQSIVYREVTALFPLTNKKYNPEAQGRDPWSKTLNWYFFAVVNYFLYGESIIYYFKHVVFSDAIFLPFATNHRFISFMLYILGFVGFVASLKKQYLRTQFGLFCWVHMTLFAIVVSSHFIINNILEGLIWFWVPASLVICNDIFAYIWGMTFGKTPLIKLSPKKTVEGFVGAFFSTLIFAVIWGTIFMRYDYMICPVRDLGTSAWSDASCEQNPVFIWRQFILPGTVNTAIESLIGQRIPPISYAPFQFHCLVLATFASLVAPFGGFFASGFKRAFDIKDFGDSIPGHGGMTDRMDCQFLMGMFSYVYFSSLIRINHATVGSVLQTIVSGLSASEQVELYYDLKRYLEGTGLTL